MFTGDYDTGWSPRALAVFRQNLGRFVAGSTEDEVPPEDSFAGIVKRHDVARKLLACCESPIEEIMAAILPFVLNGYGYPSFALNDGPGYGTFVTPQFEAGGYRLDFVVTCEWKGHSRSIGIECDGHNFHDRTKQQVAKGKSRDRKLVTQCGMQVLHYSGYELYKDPDAIGAEIEEAVLDMMRSCEIDSGDLRPPMKVHAA